MATSGGNIQHLKYKCFIHNCTKKVIHTLSMTVYFIVGVQILSSSFVSHSEQRIRLNIFYISKLNIKLAVPSYCLVIEPSPAQRVSCRR